MENKIQNLSIEEKVGQMLMVGMDTPNIIDKIDDLILKYKVGGILLYKKNYKNYKEMIELINYIKKLNSVNKIPLFIAIDQEGGRVNRMPKDFKNLPSAYSLTQKKEEDFVSQAGEITANMLNKSGYNFNFAPVLDIKRFPNEHAIGDRSFSENIEEVSENSIKYMKKLQEKNIVSTIKHFPGHGATKADTHFILPSITNNMEELEKTDMKPFENAIKNGANSLLVSHLKIKGISKGYPTSMSREFITKYIRKKYRYKGLVVTDDMRMKGVQVLYGKTKPIIKAFEAGNDIVLFKYMNNDKIIEKLIKKVKSKSIFQARVNRSVQRILKIKEKYNINDNEIKYDEQLIKETNKKIETIYNKMNLK